MDIVKLPIEKWSEYRELRLRALKEDPEAFSSSYADSLGQPEQFWKTRLAEAERGERSWLLFARRDNKLVGMIGAFIEGDSAETATVVSVYVPREERGHGVSATPDGRNAARAVGCSDAQEGAAGCECEPVGGDSRLQAVGFREIGRKPATTGAGEAVEQLVMERELPV